MKMKKTSKDHGNKNKKNIQEPKTVVESTTVDDDLMAKNQGKLVTITNLKDIVISGGGGGGGDGTGTSGDTLSSLDTVNNGTINKSIKLSYVDKNGISQYLTVPLDMSTEEISSALGNANLYEDLDMLQASDTYADEQIQDIRNNISALRETVDNDYYKIKQIDDKNQIQDVSIDSNSDRIDVINSNLSDYVSINDSNMNYFGTEIRNIKNDIKNNEIISISITDGSKPNTIVFALNYQSGSVVISNEFKLPAGGTIDTTNFIKIIQYSELLMAINGDTTTPVTPLDIDDYCYAHRISELHINIAPEDTVLLDDCYDFMNDIAFVFYPNDESEITTSSVYFPSTSNGPTHHVFVNEERAKPMSYKTMTIENVYTNVEPIETYYSWVEFFNKISEGENSAELVNQYISNKELDIVFIHYSDSDYTILEGTISAPSSRALYSRLTLGADNGIYIETTYNGESYTYLPEYGGKVLLDEMISDPLAHLSDITSGGDTTPTAFGAYSSVYTLATGSDLEAETIETSVLVEALRIIGNDYGFRLDVLSSSTPGYSDLYEDLFLQVAPTKGFREDNTKYKPMDVKVTGTYNDEEYVLYLKNEDTFDFNNFQKVQAGGGGEPSTIGVQTFNSWGALAETLGSPSAPITSTVLYHYMTDNEILEISVMGIDDSSEKNIISDYDLSMDGGNTTVITRGYNHYMLVTRTIADDQTFNGSFKKDEALTSKGMKSISPNNSDFRDHVTLALALYGKRQVIKWKDVASYLMARDISEMTVIYEHGVVDLAYVPDPDNLNKRGIITYSSVYNKLMTTFKTDEGEIFVHLFSDADELNLTALADDNVTATGGGDVGLPTVFKSWTEFMHIAGSATEGTLIWHDVWIYLTENAIQEIKIRFDSDDTTIVDGLTPDFVDVYTTLTLGTLIWKTGSDLIYTSLNHDHKNYNAIIDPYSVLSLDVLLGTMVGRNQFRTHAEMFRAVERHSTYVPMHPIDFKNSLSYTKVTQLTAHFIPSGYDLQILPPGVLPQEDTTITYSIYHFGTGYSKGLITTAYNSQGVFIHEWEGNDTITYDQMMVDNVKRDVFSSITSFFTMMTTSPNEKYQQYNTQVIRVTVDTTDSSYAGFDADYVGIYLSFKPINQTQTLISGCYEGVEYNQVFTETDTFDFTKFKPVYINDELPEKCYLSFEELKEDMEYERDVNGLNLPDIIAEPLSSIDIESFMIQKKYLRINVEGTDGDNVLGSPPLLSNTNPSLVGSYFIINTLMHGDIITALKYVGELKIEFHQDSSSRTVFTNELNKSLSYKNILSLKTTFMHEVHYTNRQFPAVEQLKDVYGYDVSFPAAGDTLQITHIQQIMNLNNYEDINTLYTKYDIALIPGEFTTGEKNKIRFHTLDGIKIITTLETPTGIYIHEFADGEELTKSNMMINNT